MNDHPTMTENEVSVVDLVSNAREAAMEAIAVYTGFDEDELGTEIPEITCIVQSIPPQLVNDVALAILGRFANCRGYDHSDPEARIYYADFDKVLAANIASATNIVMHNLREQQMRQADTQKRLMTGTLARH